ncbi:MAG: sugar phosphate isomerase/epimerase [Armatimonadota bacterium]|nr:sugar phosphate isomerase/epimerase [Armatimonadota bacterium]
MKSFDVALQLYTVRESLEGDFLGGLRKVADMGYKFVEFAGFGGHTAAEVGRVLSECGLRASGSHVPTSILDDPGPVIDELREIGCSQLTIPSIPEEMRPDLQGWIDAAKRIDECAVSLATQGLALGYHNHAFEFGDTHGFETIVERAPNANLQLDVFWATVAGEDPIAWIGRLHGRLPSIHCKDLGADGVDIELGDGVLDFAEILRAAERAGTRTLVVEMDTPRLEPMESARRSLLGLQDVLND